MNFLRSITVLSIGATIASIPSSKALTVEEVVNPRQANGGWVIDMADILDSNTEQKLNRIIAKQEQVYGTEITVVSVSETAPAESPKAFATKLFNHWRIGKAESDNGILFLISKEDNRVEIETGYGILERLSNAAVGLIIDYTILPRYREGDFNGGTLQGTQALIEALQPNIESTQAEPTFDWQNALILLFIGTGAIATIGIIVRAVKRQNKVFVKPNKNLSLRRSDNQTVCCAKCHQPMKRVREIKLTKAQRVAQKLGGVSYRGYLCSNCNLAGNSIVAYFSDSDRYDNCHECQKLTVIKTGEVITPATCDRPGQLLSKKQCHCCNYYQEELVEIPAIERFNPKKYHNYKNNSNFQHHYYYGGDASGGDGAGGNFGGGASGGDGAGGSW